MSIIRSAQTDTVIQHHKVHFELLDITIDFERQKRSMKPFTEGQLRGPNAPRRELDFAFDSVDTRSIEEEYIALASVLHHVSPEFKDANYNLLKRNCYSFANQAILSSVDAVETYREDPESLDASVIALAEELKDKPDIIYDYLTPHTKVCEAEREQDLDAELCLVTVEAHTDESYAANNSAQQRASYSR